MWFCRRQSGQDLETHSRGKTTDESKKGEMFQMGMNLMKKKSWRIVLKMPMEGAGGVHLGGSVG